jgi:hypothetical protein
MYDGGSGRVDEEIFELNSEPSSHHSQSSESTVVHDHIRLRQHQKAAVSCWVVRIGARHVKHLGTTESGETVGGLST